MPDLESQLLGNLLDSLDRLFDRETSVIDVHALVCATHAALSTTTHTPVLHLAQEELTAVVNARVLRDQQRDAALLATEDLRKYLASVVPFPRSNG